MCLGVPGMIVEVRENKPGSLAPGQIAVVDFQGSRVEVSLSLVPAAVLGDWVLVHAGYALTLLDKEEAAETWRWLDKAEVAREMKAPGERP